MTEWNVSAILLIQVHNKAVHPRPQKQARVKLIQMTLLNSSENPVIFFSLYFLLYTIILVKFTSGYRVTSTQPPTVSSEQSKMVTAGVQTGTTDDEDYRRPPNPRESQLSFSLSDLSDEEVDRRITRLTQEVKRISSNSKRISNGSQVFHLNL